MLGLDSARSKVDDAIAKLERFKQMLKDALNSESLEQVKGALKLYSKSRLCGS